MVVLYGFEVINLIFINLFVSFGYFLLFIKIVSVVFVGGFVFCKS